MLPLPQDFTSLHGAKTLASQYLCLVLMFNELCLFLTSDTPTMGVKGKKTKSVTHVLVRKRTRRQAAAKIVSPGSPLLRELPSDEETGPTPDTQCPLWLRVSFTLTSVCHLGYPGQQHPARMSQGLW